MTSVFGKRKSRTSHAEPDVLKEDAAAIFRRHFEAQFAPLEVEKPKPSPPEEDVEDLRSDSDPDEEEEENSEYEGDPKSERDRDDQDEWTGLSDEEESENENPPTIEVIDTTSTTLQTSPRSTLSKREARAYLSSHVPLSSTNSSSASQSRSKKGSKSPEEGDEDSAALLRNDLALRRLLSESHLFTQSSSSSADGDPTTHQGRTRHLATDLRLSSLGSKSSIYTQVKMPMAHRKGIAAAAAARESKRRKEARENGIILERPAAGDGKRARGRDGGGGGRRERAVDAPAVGKFRGGMLKLSKRDVREIEGPKDRGGGKRRRR